MSYDLKEFRILEEEVTEELSCAIGDLVDDKEPSRVKDCNPPQHIIEAMGKAAATVLIAWQHGQISES